MADGLGICLRPFQTHVRPPQPHTLHLKNLTADLRNVQAGFVGQMCHFG
eukprot:COSAG01_NODE_28963_length_648_cov_1.244080_1_plen_48_part_10